MANKPIAKNTICLWFDKDAEAAARFYTATFPDSAMGAVHRAPTDYPSGKKGDVLTVTWLDGRPPHPSIEAEAERLSGLLGMDLRLTVEV